MMSLEQGLVAFLNSQVAITEVVASRIFGGRRPQGKRPLPELLISRTQSTRQEKFCGQDLLVLAALQVDCFAINKDDSTALSKAVRVTLRRFSGVWGDVPINQCFLRNEYDGNDIEPGILRTILTFDVWYVED